MTSTSATRPLTEGERTLARWMLEHGSPEAGRFINQLNMAEATTWRCECGCASFNFKIQDHAEAPPGVNILGDFVFGSESELAGVFIFESGGALGGVEVYGLAGDAPAVLPQPSELRPFEQSSEQAPSSTGSGGNNGA